MSLTSFWHCVTLRTSASGAGSALSHPGGAVERRAWMPTRSKPAWGRRATRLQFMPRNRAEGEFRHQLKQQSAFVLLAEPYRCLPAITSGALPWFDGGTCRQMASFVQSAPW